MSKPAVKSEPSAKKSAPNVEVVAEAGDDVEPPPPEVLEPDPDLSPEDAEQARKKYLLTRFWISARGFWGNSGDRLAWIFSIGLVILIVTNVGFQYGINVWNRAIFDAIEKRDSATVFYLTAVFFPLASTLVRAIAGLWPWGGGSVNFHPDRRLFMLPQNTYVPSGTLRRAAVYPAAAEDWTVEQIGEALDKVGLGHLKDKIEEDAPWDQTLSGGEKQRLAFARLFLHNPDIIVLDEATSALDEKSQDQMMELMIKELPKATVVSVAHRDELEAFHSRKIVLERRKGGAKLVSDVDLIPGKGKRRLLGRFLPHRRAATQKAA